MKKGPLQQTNKPTSLTFVQVSFEQGKIKFNDTGSVLPIKEVTMVEGEKIEELSTINCNEFLDLMHSANNTKELILSANSVLKQHGLKISIDFDFKKPSYTFKFSTETKRPLKDFVFFSRNEYVERIKESTPDQSTIEACNKILDDYFESFKVADDEYYTFKSPMSNIKITNLTKTLNSLKLGTSSLASLFLNQLLNVNTIKWALKDAFFSESKNMYEVFKKYANPDFNEEYLLKNLNKLVETTKDVSPVPDFQKIVSIRHFSKLSTKHLLELRANSKGREAYNINKWEKKDENSLRTPIHFLVREFLNYPGKKKKPYNFVQRHLLMKDSFSIDHQLGCANVRNYLPGCFDEKLAVQCLQWAQSYMPNNPIENIGDGSIGWMNRGIAAACFAKLNNRQIHYYGVDPQISDVNYKTRVDSIISFCQNQWQAPIVFHLISGESQKRQTLDLWRAQNVSLDAFLTSPPYLDVEKYQGNKSNQAYNINKDNNEWSQFYVDYIHNFMSILKRNGILMFNIPSKETKANSVFWDNLNTKLQNTFHIIHTIKICQLVQAIRPGVEPKSSELIHIIRKDDPLPILISSSEFLTKHIKNTKTRSRKEKVSHLPLSVSGLQANSKKAKATKIRRDHSVSTFKKKL